MNSTGTLADTRPLGTRPTTGGYRRGDETRNRILEAALRMFGELGFKGATTREIAKAAGASLPALKYYFDNKEGLYLACAGEIVTQYEDHMLGLVSHAHTALSRGGSPDNARIDLKRILNTLIDLLVGTDKTEVWASFVLREFAERGLAFEILYQQLWRPGLELISHLISRAVGEVSPSEGTRIQAVLLISSLSAFSTARAVSLAYLGWPEADQIRFAAVRQNIEAQIDRL